MTAATPLRAHWIALGLALAVFPVTALEVLGMSILPYSGSRLDMFLRAWLWFLTCAMPIALLIGFPVAALWLRERGWIAWGLGGGVAGVIGGVAVMLVLAFATQLLSLVGHFAVLTVVVLVLATGGGVVTALLARWIALALTRRFG